MPQIWPMNWVILFMIFILTFLIFLSFIYFLNFSTKIKVEDRGETLHLYLDWKW